METHKQPARRIMSPNGKAIEDETEESILLDMKMSRISYVWNRVCHAASVGMGSLYAYVFYWIGIFVWVGIGPIFQFSNTWQLYVNTATAIVLTFASAFLQNVEQRQEENLEKSLEYATKIDCEIEQRLRELTGDTKPNPIFEILPPKIGKLDRSIDNFGNFMGSGIGLLFSLICTIVWVAVGPPLEFGDNWILILGTFTVSLSSSLMYY
jgi:low-affinity ferrous iron transport protein